MVKDILKELKKAAFSIIPIYIVILLLRVLNIIQLESNEILSFSMATIFIIIGITLFNIGAERAMMPIGKIIGKGLTKQGKIGILLLVVFIFGFLITIVEPDLKVLATQTKEIFNEWLLILLIGLSVGLFLVLAVIKIIKKTNLIILLLFLYLVAFGLVAILVAQGKASVLAMSFDAGGVTTGPMTVPFLMALSVGTAGVLAQKSEKDASFGFVAFSSIGPIIVVLMMFLFSNKINNSIEVINYQNSSFFLKFIHELWTKCYEIGLSISILFIVFLIIDLLILHIDQKKRLKLYLGLFIAYLGLVIFLASASSIYLKIGYIIGESFKNIDIELVLIIAFIIGALTVLAEPALKILIHQVEEITNGLIRKWPMLLSLAIGVGLAILLSLLRIYLNFSILYILIPGYLLCFGLAFFIPKIYTAIAFDAGGVVSGPLTSSFILPIALGYCSSLSKDVLSDGFGIVSLVALSPLLSIEILGVISLFHKYLLSKKALKKVLLEDDKIIISFD